MRRALFTLITCGGILLAGLKARSTDLNAAARPLQVNIMQEAAEFTEPYHCAFVTEAENKFTFIIPQGYRLTSDPAKGRLVFANRSGDSILTFAILGSGAADPSEINEEVCRQFALRMHPDGRILRSAPIGALGSKGPGIDIEWQVTDDLYEVERMAFVPTSYGLLVFTAASGRKHFADSQAELSQVMGSLRGSADGKFHPVHVPLAN